MLRKLLVIFALLNCLALSAQTLKTVDLGVIPGELRTYAGELIWINDVSDSVTGTLWTNTAQLAFFENTDFNSVRGDSLRISYSIDLEGKTGDQQYEIRVLDTEGVILYGFLLEARINPVDIEALNSYRNDFFPFKAKQQVFNLGGTFIDQPLEREFFIHNFGGDSLNLDDVRTNDDRIDVSFLPGKAAHNEFVRMKVVLNPEGNDRLGFTRKPLKVFGANDELITVIPIQFTLEAPRRSYVDTNAQIALSKINHDFKVVKKGDIRETIFTVTNVGSDKLILKNLEVNCSCLTYELGMNEIPPGESTELKVKYNSTGRVGYERKTLAIFSNDSRQPTRVLTFRAHVK